MKMDLKRIVLPYSHSISYGFSKKGGSGTYKHNGAQRHTLESLENNDTGKSYTKDYDRHTMPQDDYYLSRAWSLVDRTVCPHCAGQLLYRELFSEYNPGRILDREYICILISCVSCGWWLMKRSRHEENTGWANNEWFVRYTVTFDEGIVYRFILDKIRLPVAALQRELTSSRVKPEQLSHRQMEILTQKVLRQFFTCEVRYIGFPGNNDTDTLLIDSDDVYIIQIERRNGKYGCISVVRDLLGSIAVKNINRGITVTSAYDLNLNDRVPANRLGIFAHSLPLDSENQAQIREALALSIQQPAWKRILKEQGLKLRAVSPE